MIAQGWIRDGSRQGRPPSI